MPDGTTRPCAPSPPPAVNKSLQSTIVVFPGSLPEIPAWDYDGKPRIYNSYIVDMGSDEVQA